MTATPPAEGLAQPFDSTTFSDPYAAYARLRKEASVHRIALPDRSPVWLVMGEADVRDGLTDRRLSVNRAHSRIGYKGFSLPPALDANLLNLDGDDHLRLRRLVSKGFTAHRVENLRSRVLSTVNRLADSLAEQQVADLVTDFAEPLPITVIGDLFAVPECDRAPFSRWVSNMLAPAHPSHVGQAVNDIHDFLTDLVAARRAAPGNDLLSALIAARDDRDQLTENELVSLAFLILMAGSENVQHTISNGTLALLRHPQQLSELKSDPQLMSAAVEEILRYAHPDLMAIRRFPTEEVKIGNVLIPAGDTVMLCLASAHRDPARYADPDKFDIYRTDPGHLALGHGMHYCLGAPLARLQISTAIGTLIQRFPELALAVEPDQLRWRPSWRSHALRELPVRPGAQSPNY